MEQVQKKNILGTEPIVGLLRQFAVPSIIAMLVGALYNICLLYTSPSPRDTR